MVMMMVVIAAGMVLLLLPPTIGTVIVVMLIQGLRGPVAASQPGWASQSPPYQSTQSLEIERRSLTIMFWEIIVFHSADEVRAKTLNIWS